jgi:hypothetical protein
MLKQLPPIDPNSEAWDGPADQFDAKPAKEDADTEAARISWQMMQDRLRYRGYTYRLPRNLREGKPT